VIYSFDEFELDEKRCELRRAGAVIPLEPKPFAVLLHLVRQRDRVVSKQELVEAIWPAAVADESLSRAIGLVRRALGDSAAESRFVQTLWRRGFRFVAPVAPRRVYSAPRGSATGETQRPFVGRAAVLAELAHALADASAGRGRIALLTGEPGIGKTHTAERLAEIAAERSARVLTGWASSQPGAPPYWLWVRVLRGLADALDDAALRSRLRAASAEIARLLPELRARVPELAAPDDRADTSPFRLFAAVAAFLHEATRAQPLVIVLDDLQWADRSSLRLLTSLGREIAHVRVLIVLIAREAEIERRPIDETLAALDRQCGVVRIALRGLEPAEVAELVTALRADAPSVEEARAIATRAGGNPFFVQELVLAGDDDVVRAGDSEPLPRFLRDVLHARLCRLPVTGCRALEAAALAGERFEAPLVAAAIVAEPAAVTRGLASARREALIVPGRVRDEWRFAHALVHEAVRACVPEQRVRPLHLALAHAVQLCHANDLDDHSADVARHLEAALPLADREEAVAWASRAGRVALQRLAYPEAVAHCERALKLAEEGPGAPPEGLARLTLALARSRWLAGDELRAFETYERAGELASGVGDAITLADAAIGGASAGRMSGVDRREAYVALLEKALAALPEREARRRALIIARLAWASRSDEERRRLTAHALELAEQIEDDEALINALFAAHMTCDPLTEVDERLAIATRMVELASPLRQESRAPLAAGWVVEAGRLRYRDLLTSGRLREAEEESRRLLEHAERERHPTYLLIAELEQADGLLSRGRFDQAEQRVRTALATLGPVASSAASQMAFAQMLVLRAFQGRLAEVDPVFDRFAKESFAALAWRCGRTWAHFRQGRREEAQRGLDALEPDALRDLEFFHIGCLVLLAEVAAGLGDRGRCEELQRKLSPGAGLEAALGDVVLLGCISRPLGLLAAALGRGDEAAHHFERAIEVDERLGLRPWLAETRLAYASLLARRRGASARARALALLAEADATARELGMAALVADAQELRAGPLADS
jgi:predicted ATPase